MKRFFFNRWFQLSAGIVLVLLIALLSCAWYFRVWNWQDIQVYMMMRKECHPVWRDLHWSRVHAGQDVEEVIATTKPVLVERYGEFVQLQYQGGDDGLVYFTGVTITAKNGRLASASAWSCTWHRVFFNGLTSDDWQAYTEAYKAHWGPIKKKREETEKGAAAVGGGK